VLSPDTRLQPNAEEVAAKVIDGEAIMINLSNGIYYSMDGVGGLVWSLIVEQHSLDEIATAVGQQYAVSPREARQDVQRLASELLDERLVVVATSGTPRQVELPPQPNGSLDYESPQLNRYTDMGDLLALDPPMPGLEDIPWQEPSSEKAS
jgi:hypothetical protein